MPSLEVGGAASLGHADDWGSPTESPKTWDPEAHPGVQLLAGLSAGAGSTSSTNVLLHAVLNTEGAVAGQSPNVGTLSSCPNCNPSPAVAIALLGTLDGAAR